jgi:kynurenine 3-monooxygenase
MFTKPAAICVQKRCPPAVRSIWPSRIANRGIAALKEVGLDEYMLSEAVPMSGRMIHALDGTTKLLPYSGRQGEYINSVSRAGLNIALINEAEKYEGVRFFFNQKCVGFDCQTGEAMLESGEIVKADTTIGTDGAGSAIRNAMLSGVERFNFSQSWLEHGYKELHIPKLIPQQISKQSRFGKFINKIKRLAFNTPPSLQTHKSELEFNALHIWARHSFMMIALPNFDGSFTCTLFLAHTGRNATMKERVSNPQTQSSKSNDTLPNGRVSAFDELINEKSLMSFFEANFPNAIPLMPTLVEDFFTNPTGNLGTIKCFPWKVGGKSLLLGDSAHAVVPFYGQGMNASFEDCRILNQLIETHGTNWETIFDEFTNMRKPNTDAIAEMAEENFYEMRDAVANPVFQRKRELETKLEQTFPDYFSKYSMVTFREDLPYSVAKQKGNAQDKLLMEICAEIDDVSKLDLNKVKEEIESL